MNGLEALKRIRQETAPNTICGDFDKEECCNTIEKELKASQVVNKYLDIKFERTNKGPVMWVRSKTLGQGWLIHISEEEFDSVKEETR